MPRSDSFPLVRSNSSFNPNPVRCFVQTCCKLFQCRLTIVVAAGRVNSSVRRRTYSPLMPKIHATRLPNGELLEQYSASGAYTDCYSATLVGHISLADFMGVFYTTPIFKIERSILDKVLQLPSTYTEAPLLRPCRPTRFAAW